MADVKYDFAADVTAAERAIARLEAKTEKLEQQLKSNARTSKRGASDFEGDALRMVAGLVTVGSAVAVVTRAYQAWVAEIERARTESHKFNQTLLTELTLAGDLAEGGAVRQRLERVPFATREQATAAFAGVTGGSPQLAVERRIDVAADVSRLAPLLTRFDEQGRVADTGALKNLADVAGKLAEQAPGLSADDVTDLALAASESAGSRIGQLQTPGFQRLLTLMQQQGISLERSMAVGLEAIEEGVEAGSLVGVLTKAQEAGVSLDQLMADPALRAQTLEREQRAAVQLLEADDVNKLQQTFEAARRDNLAEQRLAQGRELDPTTFLLQETAIAEQLQLLQVGDAERERLAAQRAELAQSRPGSAERFGTAFGQFTENRGIEARRFLGLEELPTSDLVQKQLEKLDETNRLLREQLEEQRRANGQPPAPPPRINRNAQTE